MQGFVEFHLLKGPEAEDHTLYSSHTVWSSKARFRGVDQVGGVPQGACPRRQRVDRRRSISSHPKFEGFEVVQTQRGASAAA